MGLKGLTVTSIRTTNEQSDNGNKAGCENCKIIPSFSCTGDIGNISDCKIICGDEVLGGNDLTH